MNRRSRSLVKTLVLGSTLAFATPALAAGGAPGALQSQNNATWAYAGKTGIGTSYERYVNRRYSDHGPTGRVSKVWFSIAEGIITETAYGRIDEAQIKDLQFLVAGNGFVDEEKKATDHRVDYLHTDADGRPKSLAYRIVNTAKNGRYAIEKSVFTDPDRQTLFARVKFTALADNITPYILINPHIGNSGRYDVAYVGRDARGQGYLNARQHQDKFLSLRATARFVKMSAGFEGTSDGWADLRDNGVMDWDYDWADDGGGNVVMMAQLETLDAHQSTTFDIAVGYGTTHDAAMGEADGSLQEGHEALLKKYNGEGTAIGWEDYLDGLPHLSALTAATADGGKLL